MKYLLSVSAAALLGMTAIVALLPHKSAPVSPTETTSLFPATAATAVAIQLPVAAEPIEPGWYDWANSADKPNAPAAMGAFYTGARCLCAPGFTGIKHGETFTIVSAPPGYRDTVGKTFKAKQRVCLNCAD